MKSKIIFLIVIAITLLSLASCSVSIGGHGRVGHPPRMHHEREHGEDRD